MKALSINQPFASLILNPPHVKRVENRTWHTNYRGPLLIHAGKSRTWLKSWTAALPEPMPMGAIVGVVGLVECVHIGAVQEGLAPESLRWILNHEWASGPWCWVLENCRAFADPVPYLGCIGLFDVERSVVEAQL